jgi:uncharacterized protein (TIGR03000 family)
MIVISWIAGEGVIAQESSQSAASKKSIDLIIHLPEQAVLELMGRKMPGAGCIRRFRTPQVEVGKTYQYNIRATWDSDGKALTAEKTVEVQAGDVSEVRFAESTPSATEMRVLELVNEQRKSRGVGPFSLSDKLMTAARMHSANMALQQTLSHPLDGKDFWQRIVDTGYTPSTAAENIAQGAPDAAAVVQMWMESEGHRENILSPEYREIGIGFTTAPNGETFWTQVFASHTRTR